MKEFKIRCSAIGQIMAEGVGTITEKQLITISDYQAKEKITPKQQITLDELIAKRDAPPQLGGTARSYCKQWVKEQLYNKKHEFSSKYTEKGIKVEQDSIDFASDFLKWGMVIKNTIYFEDDFFTGTPDVVIPGMVMDVKNSWDAFTFPLFAEKIPTIGYYWQLQGYMNLTGATMAELVYLLMDTPENLIEREIMRKCYQLGVDDLTKEEDEELTKTLIYSDIEASLRVKKFEIVRDDTKIQAIKDRVELCRKYIKDELLTKIK